MVTLIRKWPSPIEHNKYESGGGGGNQISKGGEHSTTKGGLSPASPPKQNYQADHHQRTIHHLRRCQLPPPPVRIIVFANANDARANEALFPSIQHWTRQICDRGGGEQHFQGCWRMQQRKGMGGESNCNSNTVWQGCDDPTRNRIRDCVRAPQYRGCA